jgi:hypothetical protein
VAGAGRCGDRKNFGEDRNFDEEMTFEIYGNLSRY